MQDGLLLRIYIAESSEIEKIPAYRYLLHFFLGRGFPGCTVFRGLAGFGHEHRVRTVDAFELSLDLPVVIDVVDTPERILAVVPDVERMVKHGLVLVQDVRMVRKMPDPK
jgi:PII-like signaling protein